MGAGVRKVEKPWIIVFADFHSVNNANIIHIKLSMLGHWTRSGRSAHNLLLWAVVHQYLHTTGTIHPVVQVKNHRVIMISLLLSSHFHTWTNLGNLMTNIITTTYISLHLSVYDAIIRLSPSYDSSFLFDYQAAHLLLVSPISALQPEWSCQHRNRIMPCPYWKPIMNFPVDSQHNLNSQL